MRVVDESMDKVEEAIVKVPELFRSMLREQWSPMHTAPKSSAMVVTMHVEASSHPRQLARVSPLSVLSFAPKKWMHNIKNGIKDHVMT